MPRHGVLSNDKVLIVIHVSYKYTSNIISDNKVVSYTIIHAIANCYLQKHTFGHRSLVSKHIFPLFTECFYIPNVLEYCVNIFIITLSLALFTFVEFQHIMRC